MSLFSARPPALPTDVLTTFDLFRNNPALFFDLEFVKHCLPMIKKYNNTASFLALYQSFDHKAYFQVYAPRTSVVLRAGLKRRWYKKLKDAMQ
jgi:hypothetical protein